MPVPFEALLPYAIIVTLVTVSGTGIGYIKYYQNGGKRHRWGVDRWDQQMMDRDRRLTGYLRGQTDQAEAPPGFELNRPTKISFLPSQ